MNNDLYELNEKLKELCSHLDIDPDEFMVIRTKEHEKLCEAYAKLEALECFGVDNWIGYDDAMQSLYNEEEE